MPAIRARGARHMGRVPDPPAGLRSVVRSHRRPLALFWDVCLAMCEPCAPEMGRLK